jgi:hypothetical protein
MTSITIAWVLVTALYLPVDMTGFAQKRFVHELISIGTSIVHTVVDTLTQTDIRV